MTKKILTIMLALILVLALPLCIGVACSKDPNNNATDQTARNTNPTPDNTDQPIEDDNPDAPVYTGMTVDEFDASNAALSTGLGSGIEQLSSIVKLNQDTPLTPDVYQDKDIVISINFDNPKNYEILSFTVNDTKYSSYMFEQGSTMSCILIKLNVGNTWGEKEYKIAAVKYVDGTKIKDVKMKGKETTKINVYGLEKTETVDQLTYNFYSNKTAILIEVPMSLEEVIIPPFIGDYKVTAMEDNLFQHHYGCHTIVYFPESIQIANKSQFMQGSESRVVYVIGSSEIEPLGACLAQYSGIARENLVKCDDCYYIISEQGATLVRYVGSGSDTYNVPNSITVNNKTITVIEVKKSAFQARVAPSTLICEYVFNP